LSLGFGLGQALKERFYGLSWGLVGGGDREASHAAVEGVATLEAELGGGGIFEDGARDVLQYAAVEEGGEGRVEEDGEGGGSLLEEEAVGEVFGGSTAEGEDDVVVPEGRGEGGGFEAAEAGFAVLLEELGDSGVGAGLEVGVEVEEVPADAGGEEAADGGLACSHEAGEDETFEMGWGLGHGFDLGLDLGFGFGGRHCLSLVCL